MQKGIKAIRKKLTIDPRQGNVVQKKNRMGEG
jgi:hypothetical protein